MKISGNNTTLHTSVKILTVVFLIYGGCVPESENHKPFLRSSIMETDDYFEITGLGASSADGTKTEAEAIKEAEEIAYFQAVELLTEALQGVGISGNMKLRDLNIGEGSLVQLIKGRLRGVHKVGRPEYEKQPDGSWLASCTIQYPKSSSIELAGEIAADKAVRDLIANLPDFQRDYTGIVVDMRFEYSFSGIFTPKIVSPSEEELFSIRDFGREAVSAFGGIVFYSSIMRAVSDEYGVGNFPLKLVPQRYDASTNTIYLSKQDAEKLVSLPNKTSLFSEGKIAFIL
ncbi:hypothetical protein ACFL6I_17550 [candidate division KSB1 bacterium]